jgi:hypothetical protein
MPEYHIAVDTLSPLDPLMLSSTVVGRPEQETYQLRIFDLETRALGTSRPLQVAAPV